MRNVIAIAATLLLPVTSAADEFADKLQQLMAAGKAGEHTTAAESCRELALSDPQNPNAARAHYAAIVFAAQGLNGEAGAAREQAQQRYAEWLVEHIDRWPVGAHAQQARLWLAEHRLRTFEGDFETTPENADRVELVNSARKALQPLITGENNRWPARWTPLQERVATRLAEWHLAYHPQGGKYAERMMKAMLGWKEGEKNVYTDQPRPLLILDAARLFQDDPGLGRAVVRAFFAGQDRGKPAEAVRFIEVLHPHLVRLTLARRPPNQTYDELQTLDSLLSLADGLLHHHGLSQASIDNLETLVEDRPLPDNSQVAVLRHRLLSDYFYNAVMPREDQQRTTYDLNRSLTECDAWIELAPDDPDAIETRALLLSSAQGQNYTQKALQAWQLVEQRSNPAGERWRRARDARIRTLRKLGQTEAADKLQSLTELLYPAQSNP